MRTNPAATATKPTRNAYTAEHLRRDREKLGISQSELSAMLQTPKRTIQDWESGARRVPGITEVAMGMLLFRDGIIMADIKAKITARIDREYPHGIPSEREPSES